MPVVCYRLISSNLIAITRYLSLSEQNKAAANQSFSIRGISLLSLCSGHGVPLLWLTLITITTGMCLMNEYSLFKVQSHSPHIAENRCGDFYVPSPVAFLSLLFHIIRHDCREIIVGILSSLPVRDIGFYS